MGKLLETTFDWKSLVRRSGGIVRRVLGDSTFCRLSSLLPRTHDSNVVMFHIGRSGSTVLGNLLRQHHRIYWDGEILSGHEKEVGGRTSADGLSLTTRWRKSRYYPADPYRFLRARFPIVGFRRYYGMEVKFFHLNHNGILLDDFIDFLKQNRFKNFIVLKRHNFLRKVVSSIVGFKKGAFHTQGAASAKPERIVINVDRVQIDGDAKPLLAFFDDWTQEFARLNALLATNDPLELSYELDVERNPLAAYEKCCDHLAIPPYSPVIKFSRTNPFPLKELVDNYSDLARALTNTRYEWMLEENGSVRLPDALPPAASSQPMVN